MNICSETREVVNCDAAAASFVRHGSQEIPIFIIGFVVYLSMEAKIIT
jgi:hypothetical protein